MTHKIGPTGFSLARVWNTERIRCVVAALEAATSFRGHVATCAKDSVHLIRLLRLHDNIEVAVPLVERESVRDLVQAREDCPDDLMRARHRVSNLLFRQGLVCAVGQA